MAILCENVMLLKDSRSPATAPFSRLPHAGRPGWLLPKLARFAHRAPRKTVPAPKKVGRPPQNPLTAGVKAIIIRINLHERLVIQMKLLPQKPLCSLPDGRRC